MSLGADVVVVGAGAAGLWCAWRAAARGARVLVLEKTARTGTKILASGGTRCNLTTTLDGRGAARLFGARGERFLGHALRILPPTQVRAHFAELGVPTVEALLEKIFPASQRARDVRDALESAARAAGARFVFDAQVARLAPCAAGWRVELERGEPVECANVVLAVGGKSYPRTGTTGDGYAWLATLGLELVDPVPALVPLISPEIWVRDLAGIALQDAELRHVAPQGASIERRRRPLVFTHAGLSGPAAMDLAEPIARAESSGEPRAVAIDLYPEWSEDRLRAELMDAAARPGAPRLSQALERAGMAPPPKRLLARIAATSGALGDDPRLNALSRSSRHALVQNLKGLRVALTGTTGFDHAEVTAGGLALGEVDPGTCRVRRYAGLFAIGEILDLQGPIGGLNFQAAFATAEVAALELTR